VDVASNTITFEMRAQTQGWVGVGFGGTPGRGHLATGTTPSEEPHPTSD
jgi:hypothetical protein